MRILLIAANSQWTERLDLEEELRGLQDVLKQTRYRDAVELEIGHAARPEDLAPLLSEVNPDIVHFSGHGSEAGIILRDANGNSVEVTGEALRDALKGRGVKLVVFNVCYAADNARTVSDAVDCVIGTTQALEDGMAGLFSVGL